MCVKSVYVYDNKELTNRHIDFGKAIKRRNRGKIRYLCHEFKH